MKRLLWYYIPREVVVASHAENISAAFHSSSLIAIAGLLML
jgi:hypothetical protein